MSLFYKLHTHYQIDMHPFVLLQAVDKHVNMQCSPSRPKGMGVNIQPSLYISGKGPINNEMGGTIVYLSNGSPSTRRLRPRLAS